MIKKQDIEFVEVSRPVRELMTKFGGQPVWLEWPQRPLSRSTGQPMQFICQIKLEPEIFGQIPARMAYLFMTSDDLSNETWQHDGGEIDKKCFWKDCNNKRLKTVACCVEHLPEYAGRK